MSVQDLHAVVSRCVQLRKIGPERWCGLCPFHNEKTSSFQVWKGRRGEGRYHCHGCGADGDGVDWLRKFEGKTFGEAGGAKPDPEIRREQVRRRDRERAIKAWYDRFPDSVPIEWLL